MFFNYKHMEEFGYKVVGLHTHSRQACYNYAKYFPDTCSMVVRTSDSSQSIMTFHLTRENYDMYQAGKVGLKMEHTSKLVHKGEVKNRKEMGRLLAEAEEFAKSHILIRGKLIQI
jgi:hypothetical protein